MKLRPSPAGQSVVLAVICCSILGCGLATKKNELVNAVRRNDVARVNQLIADGVNIDLVENGGLGETPVSAAASWGYTNVLQVLISNGANPNTPNRDGTVPLMSAIGLGDSNLPVVITLVQNGANINAADKDGNSVIDYAVARRATAIVSYLEAQQASSSRAPSEE